MVHVTRRFSAVGGLMLAGCVVAFAQGQPVVPGGGQGTANAPTFSKDVAPVLYKNCTSCHRAGEIAPMSLVTYEEA